MHCHMQDVMGILEEVNHPYLCCHHCDMFVLCKSLNTRHPNTALCAKGGERKCFGMAVEEAREQT